MKGWISWIRDADGGFSVDSQAIAIIGNPGCGKTTAIRAIYETECARINAAFRSGTMYLPCTLPLLCSSMFFPSSQAARQLVEDYTLDFNHEKFIGLVSNLSRYRYYNKHGFVCLVDNADLWLPPKGQGRNRAVKFLLREFPHTQFFFAACKPFKCIAPENTFRVDLNKDSTGFTLTRMG